MTSERAAGFTLLEMLVVLLIAGMALALTTQALGQYQRAHSRAIASERAGREYRLSEAWFRQSVRGLYPAAPAGTRSADAAAGRMDAGASGDATLFAGTADGFTGVTLQPVLAGQGIPTLQSWRIVRSAAGDDRLELEEAGSTLALHLPPSAGMRLHYVDPAGALHDQWPPRLGAWKQLPAAVVLELRPEPGERDGRLVASAILGPEEPLDPVETRYEYSNE